MARETTVTTTSIGPTTITGGSETGGVVTGGSTDIIRGGTPGRSTTRVLVTAEENARKEAEFIKKQKEAEAKRLLEQKTAERVATEQKRINDLTVRLAKQGQTRTSTAIDKDTGNVITIETTQGSQGSGDERVTRRTDTTTGKVTTRTFERPVREDGKGGGLVQQTGGIIQTPQEGLLAPLDTGTINTGPQNEGRIILKPDEIASFGFQPTPGQESFALSQDQFKFISNKDNLQREILREQKQKPFSQLLKEGQLPTAVLKGFDVVGGTIFGFSDKIRRETIGGGTLTPEQKALGGTIIGETLLFTSLGGFQQTTAQIERSLFTKTDVVFGGASQKVNSKTLSTDVAFTTSKGEEGLARGLSQQIGKSGRLSVDATSVKGATFKTKPNTLFKLGEESIKAGRKIKFKNVFAGRQLSATATSGKRFVSTTVGRVRSSLSKSVDDFTSLSFGLADDTRTVFAGGVETSSGGGNFLGVITKAAKKSAGSSGTISTGSLKQATQLKQAAKSVQEIVTAAVQTTTKVPFTPSALSGGVGGGSKVTLKQVTKTSTLSTPSLQTITRSPTRTIIKVAQRSPELLGASRVRTKQRSALESATRVRTQLKQELALGVKTKQKTKQRERLATRQTLKQISSLKLRSGFGNTPITPRRPPKLPKIKVPFLFKSSKEDKSSKGLFGVSVRRKGKFKPFATGLSLKKAISVGKGRVETTTAATFKITSSQKGLTQRAFGTPKGFRRKAGGLFIEKRGRRISTFGEVTGLQRAKKRKKRK